MSQAHAPAESTTASALWFTGPRQAEIREERVDSPGPDQVLVRAMVSLVSSGTEMLIYRGLGAGELGLETCQGAFPFPVKYAYQVVGEVLEAGAASGVTRGQRVFARHPHQTVFCMNAHTGLLTQLPPGMDPARAVFMNLLTVAVTSQLDVPVRHGDCVVVYGQGIVGYLCAQLARRTAGTLIVVDPLPTRRERAAAFGADHAVSPDDAAAVIEDATAGRGVDVAIEASGSPAALQSAILATGQEGVIVAVSFFGTQSVPLVLAPEFHYRRQHIVSSQVSTLGSGLQPRWTPKRRDEVALEMLEGDWLITPVTHRLPFSRAPEAYALIDERPDEALGVLLDYPGE